MNKFSVPIRYGVIGALVYATIGFISYMLYRQLFSSFMTQILFGIVVFGIGIFIPVFGGVTFRRAQGGSLSFKDAFLGVFIICAVSAVGSSVMTYVIPNIIDTEYPQKSMDLIQSTTRETMEKFGAPDEKIEEAMQRFKIENFKPGVVSTLKGYGISLIWGLVLSLIIAAFIRRNNEKIALPDDDMATSPTSS
ncbi:MAG: hypothetical protein JWO06_1725 [Bacteroidota bacterium]|nr:hypothetical protein [Bacteroidota bacterium]